MSKGNGYGSRKAWLDYVKNKSMASLAGPTPCLSFPHFLGATLHSNLCIFPKDSNLSCFLFLRAYEYSAQAKGTRPLLIVFDKSHYWGKTTEVSNAQFLLNEMKNPTGDALFVEPKLFRDFITSLLTDPANKEVFRRFKSDVFLWFGARVDIKPASSFLLLFSEKAKFRLVCAGRNVPSDFVMLSDAVVYSEQPWKVRLSGFTSETTLGEVLGVKAATSSLGGFNLKG